MALPVGARKDIGVALYAAQIGEQSAFAYPMAGFGGAHVLEIVSDLDGNTYRGVYTVKFEDAIYVLHVFQKKSKRGSQIPKPDMDLIKRRLKLAANHCERSRR